jgi:PKD repeat protein
MLKPNWYRGLALLLCLCPFSSFAVVQLLDSENFVYDFGKDGMLQRGSIDAFAGMYRLRVNRTNYTGNISGFTVQGREASTATFIEPSSGLQVERSLYVAKMLNFARYTEVLHNTSDTPRDAEVEVYGTLGGNVELISSQDNFLITRAKTTGTVTAPSVLHYHSQVGSTTKPKVTLTGNQLSWIYTLSVPAKSTVRLIYFIAQAQSNDIAKQIAGTIYNNPSVLYEGMDSIARSQLRNFSAPTINASNDFSKAAFLSLGEVRKGTLQDNSAPAHRRLYTVADAYALPLTIGQQVNIRLSAAFNTYLYLYDDVAGKNLIAENDNASPSSNNAELAFTATKSATYYIETTSYDASGRGDYSLEIQKGAVSRAPILAALDVAADSFIAPASINFTDFSAGLGSNIVERCWQFGDGSAVSCGAAASNSHTFTQAGRYNVSMIAKDDKGLRSVQSVPVAIAAAASGIILPVSNTVTGELASSDSRSQTRSSAFGDRYRISSVSAGQELAFDLKANNFDSYLYVYDSYNQLLRQSAYSVRYTPWQSGDLFVEATSYKDNTLGTYSLSVNPASNTDTGKFGIENAASLSDSLQNLLVARLPESFKPTFLTWDFGDGTASTSSSDSIVSHHYPAVGQFTVSVTAHNAQQQILSSAQAIQVSSSSLAPTAHFRNSPLFGEKPLRVFFNNESSPNVAGDSLNYLWKFGDGEVSTDSNPAHTFTQAGTYNVTLEVSSTSTPQTATYSLPISVIERSTATDNVIGAARLRPQVLLAGFDPMIVDIADTSVKIFAIVRAGGAAVQTVRLMQNNSPFTLVLQQVASYANGDQRYEAVFTFAKGSFSTGKLTNLFGDQSGQLRVQAIDQSGQFHAFPNLEVGDNPSLSTAPSVLHIEPVRQSGTRRVQAQVLAAGLDPALVDSQQTEFTVKAIVREGLYPIQSVSLQQVSTGIRLPMRWLENLPNGDQIYTLSYAYPRDSLPNMTFGNLWGDAGGWSVLVTDQAQQSHRYPEVLVGNFAPL